MQSITNMTSPHELVYGHEFNERDGKYLVKNEVVKICSHCNTVEIPSDKAILLAILRELKRGNEKK